jgi:phage terminase large subunit-like protein
MRDYVEIARQYRDQARRDKRGKRFCKWVRLAAEREFQDQQRTKRKGGWGDYYFDPWWAADACGFIEKLPHVEGSWETKNIRLEPWQIFILCTVFGWRRQTGEERSRRDPRRFNTVYIECARKNAKSTLTAGVAEYCLCCEGEVGPQVKVAATTGSQARIVFGIAKSQVEKTSAMREAFNLSPMANSIVCWKNGGHIQPINSKASTQDGLNPHLTIIDELHAHADRSLFDVLKSARGSRKNPLSWYITTAGYNQVGVCYEQRTLVTKILQGVLPGDHYFGIIYTLDEEERGPNNEITRKADDPFDEKNWIKANPNLGISVDLKEMRDFAKEAKASPQSEGEFKTKRLNLWLNAAQAWLNMAQWDACADSKYKIEQFEGQEAWVGCDLADRRDVAAVVLLVLTDEGWPIWFPIFYLPEDNVKELAHSTHTHYDAWAKQGLFKLTPGNFIDYSVIEEDIRALVKRFDVLETGFDQFGSAQIASRLAEDGIETIIVPKNSKSMTDPALDLEGRIKSGLCRHDGNPVMKWMASNCCVDRRIDGSILPKKENKDSNDKIDGIDALLVAYGRMMVAEKYDITQAFVEV